MFENIIQIIRINSLTVWDIKKLFGANCSWKMWWEQRLKISALSEHFFVSGAKWLTLPCLSFLHDSPDNSKFSWHPYPTSYPPSGCLLCISTPCPPDIHIHTMTAWNQYPPPYRLKVLPPNRHLIISVSVPWPPGNLIHLMVVCYA